MSLRTLACVIAEGAAPDRRGLLSLIGLENQVWNVESFPTTIAPVFYILAEDDDVEPILVEGVQLNFTCRVTSPGGDTLLFQQEKSVVQPRQIPDLSHRVSIVLQLPFVVGQDGDYTVTASVVAPNGSHDWSRTLRVLAP